MVDVTARPAAVWDGLPQAPQWTEASLAAIAAHGAGLTETVPVDIESWCPGYGRAGAEERAAFWTGFISALAEYESTFQPAVRGGRGRWIGLLQIAPATARGYGCAAGSVSELSDGAANLACGVRIMAATVARDGAIATRHGRWQGVAADWGPLRNARIRSEMSAWTRSQAYCR